MFGRLNSSCCLPPSAPKAREDDRHGQQPKKKKARDEREGLVPCVKQVHSAMPLMAVQSEKGVAVDPCERQLISSVSAANGVRDHHSFLFCFCVWDKVVLCCKFEEQKK
jgi:hypothetical protein